MWIFVARIILKYRLVILLALTAITIGMGFKAKKVEIAYEFAKLLPDNDSTSIDYDNFKKQFGLDGTVMFLGIQADELYQLEKFNAWFDLGADIKNIKGIQQVVSVSRLYNLTKNDSLGKFEFKPLFTEKPKTQAELDSLKELIYRLPVYENFIFNKEKNSTVMAITFDKGSVNGKERLAIVDSIRAKAVSYAEKSKTEVHYSGMPYIRTIIARKITNEMVMFMGLALLVTCIILSLLFRSALPVIFSLLVVVVGVIWSFGTIVLFGYKITVLSGLIPPLIIVIGVPNCIMLLNKYHTEYSKTQDKMQALSHMIEKIGVSLLFANLTTSIGFAVFCSTDSKILVEFGLVSSLNVMATYLISLVLIPILFSYLPPPSIKHTKHLQAKFLTKVLAKVDFIVHHHRRIVYATVIVVTLISLYGMTRISALGYVVDDLPKKDPVYVDMAYFENVYGGVLPFEITIDTKKEKGIFADNAKALYKINNLQKLIREYKEFSRPVSVADGVKFSYQALKDGNPKYYRLPGALDMVKIADYAAEVKGKQNLFSAYIDSTKRYTRVSVGMADVGSIKMKELVKELKPRIDSVFNYDYENNKWLTGEEKYDVKLTGNSLMFLKGNDFLVINLLESVLLAVVLISIVLFTLFMSARMILISVLPSLIPLFLTAGLMGYFNIHLKPSTILIFSIAFGIASDGTLYFLTKYRQELINHQFSISKTVSLVIRETGVSMIYTAVILACGFGIFTASSFGGTAALGLLISVTLLVAYCSNLILLPSFLLSLEKRLTFKAFLNEPLIEIFDEDADENLDDLKIEIKKDESNSDDKNS